MYEFIPNELKNCPNWVCWSAIPDPKSHSGIKKVPICALNGNPAKSNDPTTWTTFENALISMKSGNFSGIGFMFSNSDFFGVDIDDCRDEIEDYNDDGTDNIVYEFIYGLQSYAELSQSGNGIHLICKGKLPNGARRKGKVEMYDSGRFFIMTGNSISEFAEITDCTEKIKSLHSKYLCNPPKKSDVSPKNNTNICATLTENEILEKALSSKNNTKFARLYAGDFSDYNSQSEADYAFCNMLAFWCRGDIQLMDSIYRNSGLMREKWDRRTSGSTYGRLLLEKCANECSEFYLPNKSGNYSISVGNDEKQPMYTLDDTGNAQRMYDLCSEILRYCYVDKRWLYYDNGKWSYDNKGIVCSYADKVLERMKEELKTWAVHEEGKFLDDFRKHLKKTRSNASKNAMIREFEHLVPIAPSELDTDSTLVNAQNGVISLENGEISGHSPEYCMTRMLGTSIPENPKKPEKWLKFLDGIFSHDTALIRYVQKALGYCLSGLTSEQCVFFLYGNGRNGKSTFLEVIRNIMGDYATNIQPESIMMKYSQSSANTDIARLKGARLVTSVEPNEGMRLNEGLLKQITGDDMITARKLYGNEFEFRPEFKFWMATNHKPTIRGTDLGIWRRIHIIPFTVTIPEDRIDKNLGDKLADELPDILAWIAEGYRLWTAEGLHKPKVVEDAVKEYQSEMDVISAFLSSDFCVDGGEAKASALYAVYCQWAAENNEYKMPSRKFGIEMTKHYDKIRKTDAFYYKGVSLGGITVNV